MKGTTNPVAAQVFDHFEAVGFRGSLDGSADTIERSSRASPLHGLIEGSTSGMAQSGLLGCRRRYNCCSSRVGEVTPQLSRHIDVQDVTRSNHSITRDAVCGLFVDADAG